MSKIKDANKKIEEIVVGSYKKVEKTVTGNYKKIEDKFVDMFLKEEDESIEKAKMRLKEEAKARQTQDDKLKTFNERD